MNWFCELGRRLLMLLRRAQFDIDLADEMRLHRELREREQIQRGLSPSEAHYAAQRRFGNDLILREESRDMWGWNCVEGLLQDIHYAFRQFGRSPGLVAVAILSLVLGIGANTAIFTITDAVLWKRLPVKDPQELVKIQIYSAAQHRTRDLPTPVLQDFLTEGANYGFSGVLAHVEDGLCLEVEGRAERVMGDVVTPNFFAVLGIKPHLGQMFSEQVLGGAWRPEIVLPYDYWKRRFRADPGIVGRIVRLNGYAFTVVGVSPPGFHGLDVGISPEVRIPMLVNGLRTMPALPLVDPASESTWSVLARLKPGMSARQAQGIADPFFQRLTSSRPRLPRDAHLNVTDGSHGSSFVEEYKATLLILLCLVGLILLIACVNLANLLLGRAVAREREMAVRLALGAARARLIRQLLTESVLLSLTGGILGVLSSLWGTHLIFSFLPQTHITLSMDLHPDLRALAFTFVIAVTTGVAFGLAPTFQATRVNLTPALKGDAPTALTKGGPHVELRDIFMVCQITISTLLLVGAGLFVHNLENLESINPGFNSDGIALFTMKHVHERYTPAQVVNFCRELIERVQALPGVKSAGLAEGGGPFSGRHGKTPVSLPGSQSMAGGNSRAMEEVITPGFLQTLGVPLLEGRDFSNADESPSRKIAIVNDVLVRELFGTGEPLGRQIQIGRPPYVEDLEIVGVVRGIKYASLKEPIPPEVFVPLQGIPWMPALAVRTSGDPNALIQPVLRQFQELDKNLPVFNIKTMRRQVDDSVAPERMIATLAGFFGVLAIFLASIGLYGVMAYAVTRRTREIGIRMILGAKPHEMLAIVLKKTLRLVGIGLAIGLPLALGGGYFLSKQFFGLKPWDPVAFGVATLTLVCVAFAASYLPARRAASVDPMFALRYE